MRILILEKDHLQCDLFDLVLRRNGFEPIICDDPLFIRDKIRKHQPEVLIMDTRLPDQNGIDLLLELKAENILENVFIIILSALGFPCIVKQIAEAGADVFLVKPLDMNLLISRLRTFQIEKDTKSVSSFSQET